MARLDLHLVRVAPEALQRTARFAIEVEQNPDQRRHARGFPERVSSDGVRVSKRMLNYRGEARPSEEIVQQRENGTLLARRADPPLCQACSAFWSGCRLAAQRTQPGKLTPRPASAIQCHDSALLSAQHHSRPQPSTPPAITPDKR